MYFKGGLVRPLRSHLIKAITATRAEEERQGIYFFTLCEVGVVKLFNLRAIALSMTWSK